MSRLLPVHEQLFGSARPKTIKDVLADVESPLERAAREHGQRRLKVYGTRDGVPATELLRQKVELRARIRRDARARRGRLGGGGGGGLTESAPDLRQRLAQSMSRVVQEPPVVATPGNVGALAAAARSATGALAPEDEALAVHYQRYKQRHQMRVIRRVELLNREAAGSPARSEGGPPSAVAARAEPAAASSPAPSKEERELHSRREAVEELVEAARQSLESRDRYSIHRTGGAVSALATLRRYQRREARDAAESSLLRGLGKSKSAAALGSGRTAGEVGSRVVPAHMLASGGGTAAAADEPSEPDGGGAAVLMLLSGGDAQRSRQILRDIASPLRGASTPAAGGGGGGAAEAVGSAARGLPPLIRTTVKLRAQIRRAREARQRAAHEAWERQTLEQHAAMWGAPPARPLPAVVAREREESAAREERERLARLRRERQEEETRLATLATQGRGVATAQGRTSALVESGVAFDRRRKRMVRVGVDEAEEVQRRAKALAAESGNTVELFEDAVDERAAALLGFTADEMRAAAGVEAHGEGAQGGGGDAATGAGGGRGGAGGGQGRSIGGRGPGRGRRLRRRQRERDAGKEGDAAAEEAAEEQERRAQFLERLPTVARRAEQALEGKAERKARKRATRARERAVRSGRGRRAAAAAAAARARSQVERAAARDATGFVSVRQQLQAEHAARVEAMRARRRQRLAEHRAAGNAEGQEGEGEGEGAEGSETSESDASGASEEADDVRSAATGATSGPGEGETEAEVEAEAEGRGEGEGGDEPPQPAGHDGGTSGAGATVYGGAQSARGTDSIPGPASPTVRQGDASGGTGGAGGTAGTATESRSATRLEEAETDRAARRRLRRELHRLLDRELRRRTRGFVFPEWMRQRSDFGRVFEGGDSRVVALALQKEPAARENFETQALCKWLRRFPIFKQLSEQKIRALSRVIGYQNIDAGVVICREGEPGFIFYVILSGEVEVRTSSGGVVGYLRQEQSFGESSLLDAKPRSATVTALAETELLSLEKRNFDEIVRGQRQAELWDMARFLRRVTLFESWSRTRILHLCRVMHVTRFKAGETIVAQGSPCTHFHVLRKGHCCAVKEIRTYRVNRWPAGKQQWRERRTLHRTTQVVRELRAGEPFGEESLLIEEPNLFSFVARTPCIVLSLHRANLSLVTSSLRTLALLRRRARRHLTAGAPEHLSRLRADDELLPGELGSGDDGGADGDGGDGDGEENSPWGSEDVGAMSPTEVELDHGVLQPLTMAEEERKAAAARVRGGGLAVEGGSASNTGRRGSRRVRFAVDSPPASGDGAP